MPSAPTEMELRVAKAICAEADGPWERYSPDEQAHELRCARAAIAAMREPTNVMVSQGERAEPKEDHSLAEPDVIGWRDRWRLSFKYSAMINAALSKDQG